VVTFNINQLTGHEPVELHSQIPLFNEAAVAFLNMKSQAEKEGISFQIFSGYRSYEDQKKIWEKKVEKLRETILRPEKRVEKILEFSAIPGTSRHHYGTDVDIVGMAKAPGEDPLLAENYVEPSGVYHKIFLWLLKYSFRYGFQIAYSKDPSRGGFQYEPWHFSYAPLSKPFLASYLKQNWQSHIRASELSDGVVLQSQFLRQYELQFLLGVHLSLLPGQ